MSRRRVHTGAVHTGALAVMGVAALLAMTPTVVQAAAGKGRTAAATSGAETIAAVVNNEAISSSDVDARLRLGMLGTGLPDNAETRQRLRPQVLRQLIDERLQSQEAKRLGITVPPNEIEDGLERIAKQNGTSRAALNSMLASRRISVDTLRAQVEAVIGWQRVLQRRVRQDIVIGGEEVDAAMDRMRADIGKPEFLLAEIFLAVDNPGQDAEVRRLAERLSSDLRRGGNFPAVARQFSQTAGAANGGDLGWVRQGDLRNELDDALKSMRPGQLSAPIRTADGYHILLVRAQRVVGSNKVVSAPPPRPQAVARPDLAKTKVNMRQIVFPASANTDEARKAASAQAEAVRKTIGNCAQFDQKARENGLPESGDMGTVAVKDLPANLGKLVVSIPVGKPSPVLSGPGGAILLIVCKRDMPMIEPPPAPEPEPVKLSADDARLPSREEIENDMINQRAEALSRRYLRDLRRSAFIEIR